MTIIAPSRAHRPLPSRPRLHWKAYMVSLLVVTFVSACYFYTRQDKSFRNRLVPLQQPSWSLSNKDEFATGPSQSASALPRESGSPLNLHGASPDSASHLEVGGANRGSNSDSSSHGEVPMGVLNNYDDDHDDDNKDDNEAVRFDMIPDRALTPESPRAVVIEWAMIPNLLPLMLHFAAVLGPSWGIILFILEENWIEPQSPAYQRLQASGHIEIRFLPAGTSLASEGSVSAFLTSSWFWEQVLQAHRVLLFQTDSILCSKSQAMVEDYFEYDFVGAPIAPMYGQGYNGGLSIRNPALFWHIVQEANFSTSGHKFEDQFFFDELKKRGAALPDEMVAKTFSVETIYYETPLGYHQPQRWQPMHLKTIVDWCPEVKMLIGRRVL